MYFIIFTLFNTQEFIVLILFFLLFHEILTFMGYFNAKGILLKEQLWYYSWDNMFYVRLYVMGTPTI